MPDRIIRDEILTSERYWSVSIEAQRLFIHLILVADDMARFSGKNFTIRSACFPGQSMDPAKLEKMLAELADVDLIRLWITQGERFIFIPRWKQRLRYQTSKYPEPPKEINDIPEKKSDLSPTQVRPRSDRSQSRDGLKSAEEKRSEEKRSEEKNVGAQASPESGRSVDSLAAAFLAEKVQPPTPAASELDADRRAAIAKRATQIAVLVIGEERKRKKQARIQPSDPLLLKWAEQGITDAQMLLAYGQAVARREADGDPSAINAGLLDAILPSILAPPRKRRDTAWKRTPEGVAKKAREMGWTVPAGWSAQQAIERLESMEAGHD